MPSPSVSALFGSVPSEFLDSRITVAGVASTFTTTRGLVTGARFYTEKKNISVLSKGPDPFSVPMLNFDALGKQGLNKSAGGRVRIKGSVTYYEGGTSIFVSQGTNGVYVSIFDDYPIRVGDVIEASGYVSFDGYSPLLEYPLIRNTGARKREQPQEVTGRDLRGGSYDTRLVQLNARVICVARREGKWLITAQADQWTFDSFLCTNVAPRFADSVLPGSVVKLSGVCSVTGGQGGTRASKLLLRDQHDVIVLSTPGWWTVERAVIAAISLGVVLLLCMTWVISLRTLAASQTRKISIALEQQERLTWKYKELFDSSVVGIYQKAPDGKLTGANKALAQILGFERSHDLLETFSGEKHWYQDSESWRLFQKALTSGSELRGFESQAVRRDGQVIWISETARVVRSVVGAVSHYEVFVEDVTLRKQTEGELQTSQQLYASVVEKVPACIFRKDLAGTYTFCNSRFAEWAGKSITEIIGKADFNIFPADIASKLREQDVTVEREGRVLETIESYSFLGIKRTIHLLKSPLLDSQNKTASIQGIFWDVTDRVVLEEQLRQSQKLESVGRLAGGVAHDFNNLLTIILGNITLIDQSALSEEHRTYLEGAQTAGQRASNLTQQLLTYSRKQSLRTEVIQLNEVVSNHGKMLRRLIPAQVEVVEHLSSALPGIRGDVNMIEQIIMNLAINASDAMPSGGTLWLTTEVCPAPPALCARHKLPSESHCVRFVVSDTGRGIPLEHQAKLFEPFFTTKQIGKGTGLGLATVHSIVQQHGGVIEVQSEPGKGARFLIYFPSAEEKPEASIASTPSLTRKGKSQTILVVEDEESLAELASKLLRKLGYNPLTAKSYSQATHVWAEHRSKIDLLLTDIILPGTQSGVDLAAHLLSDQPHLKVVYTSGYTADKIPEKLTLEDGINFLPKPYNVSSLASILSKHLN